MRVLLALLLSVLTLGPAAAFSAADRAAVQSTIERQLQAFLADDAAAAYSFAAPGIKALFPTKDIFMDMVRQGYQPVYRPSQHTFGALEEKAGHLEQRVDIIDAGGQAWTALYTLEKEPDGSWKITSCRLLKKDDKVA